MQACLDILSYLYTLSEAIKYSVVVHRPNDPMDKVVVGELAVRETNKGISKIIRLRNSLAHLDDYTRFVSAMDIWESELNTLAGFGDNVPEMLSWYINEFYLISNMDVLSDLYVKCSTVNKITDNIYKLKWCKENAPDALSGAPDEQILEYMSSSYDKFVLSSIYNIFVE